MSQFEIVSFQVRKYLKSMALNEERSLSERICKYATIKSTAAQLKKLGCGSWRVHITPSHQTIITRTE